MNLDEKKVSDMISAAVTEEKAKHIKRMVEKGFDKELIMDICELVPIEYAYLYSKLFPFGHFTGPFKKFEEQEVKIRMLQKAGYSKEEAELIIEKYPLFLPDEVENKLLNMSRKDQGI